MKPLLLILLALPAFAAPTRLDRILGAREHVITAAEVRSLGERPDRLLIAAASDDKASRWKRARALIALQHAPSEEALTFLRFVIANKQGALEGADVLELSCALSSLRPYGKDTLADVLPFLTHASADVRQAAVVTLSPLPEAQTALRARLYMERDAAVRDALSRSIRR
jgi:hypothetical protein